MNTTPCSDPNCRRVATHASGRCIYHTTWKNYVDPANAPVASVLDTHSPRTAGHDSCR